MTDELVSLRDALGLEPGDLLDQSVRCIESGATGSALALLRALQADLDVVQRAAVQALRSQGKSWAEVGTMLGVSAAAAHKRYRSADTADTRAGHNFTRARVKRSS